MSIHPIASCRGRWAVSAGLSLAISLSLMAQTSSTTSPGEEEEEIVTLSPFTVEGTAESGYMASSTLAGTRLRTELRDIGSSVSVLTSEFLQDIGATDNLSALTYATNTEVWGLAGNYQNAPNTGSWGQTAETSQHFSPSTQTRVRGLTSADNTRNYFRTNVAWDGYNVGRIDLLRGPNSILFGLGSPGGVVNATTDQAVLNDDRGEIGIVTDEFGSLRATASFNQVLIENQLAIRLALLSRNDNYQQEPAYDDENRVYVATKFRPEVFNKRGMTFDFSVDFEKGEGQGNRPRTAPPLDYVTAFVDPISTQPITLPAGSNYNGYADGVIPAYTQFGNQAGLNFLNWVTFAPAANPAYQRIADAFGPRLNINSNEYGGDFWRVGRVPVYGARNANGTIYTGQQGSNTIIWGYGGSTQEITLDEFNQYLQARGHPFGANFVPLQISDPTVFDFYNKLLDGPNKKEWNDFDQVRLVLSNTFFQQKLGYELSYFKEHSDRWQTTLLSDAARIWVDLTTDTIEQTPNPNFGRPFAQETTFAGNRWQESEIEGFRGSAFYQFDFAAKERTGSWWRRILGRHTLNAAYQTDTASSDRRDFPRHVVGDSLLAMSGNQQNLFAGTSRVSLRYYLGPSLVGRTSMSGANIGNMDRYVIPPGGMTNIRYFDTAWNAPSVAYNAPWTNPQGQNRTQSTNWQNYVGWQNGDFEIFDALSGNQEDLDYATRSANLNKNTVDSRILTWQGHLFDGLLVGTVGWRKDESTSATYRADVNPTPKNNAIITPDVYTLDNPATVRDSFSAESRNFSAVVHLDRLPWVGDRLPLNVSFSYNEGENFNPTSGRRDVNGAFLGAPSGETEEYGILLSTKDGKYTLRVTKFETAVLNTTSVQIPNANFRFNQFLTLNPKNLINDIENGDLRLDFESNPNRTWSIDDQENIHGPAWRQFEKDFAAAFPGFVSSWLTQGTYAPMDRDANFAANFANTEDNVSKGYEIEFTANPTASLRLSVNASQTEALRDNVPGDSTRSVYEFINNAMFNPDGTPTNAGLMRSGYDTLNDTMANFWYVQNWVFYAVTQQLNGQKAAELVEWRLNGLVNYTFTEGRLRGFGLGGAVRWESGRAIGYPYYFNDFGQATADIFRPFESDSNDRYDVWVRYQRKLWEKRIDWSVQLNVQNVLGDNELIPVRANPDGTAANFRIQQGQTWRLSNTFRF